MPKLPTTIELNIKSKDGEYLFTGYFDFDSSNMLLNTSERMLPLLFGANTSQITLNTLDLKLNSVKLQQGKLKTK
jgi:hypothetical protein